MASFHHEPLTVQSVLGHEEAAVLTQACDEDASQQCMKFLSQQLREAHTTLVLPGPPMLLCLQQDRLKCCRS